VARVTLTKAARTTLDQIEAAEGRDVDFDLTPVNKRGGSRSWRVAYVPRATETPRRFLLTPDGRVDPYQ
jgi:hypothetical protein